MILLVSGSYSPAAIFPDSLSPFVLFPLYFGFMGEIHFLGCPNPEIIDQLIQKYDSLQKVNILT